MQKILKNRVLPTFFAFILLLSVFSPVALAADSVLFYDTDSVSNWTVRFEGINGLSSSTILNAIAFSYGYDTSVGSSDLCWAIFNDAINAFGGVGQKRQIEIDNICARYNQLFSGTPAGSALDRLSGYVKQLGNSTIAGLLGLKGIKFEVVKHPSSGLWRIKETGVTGYWVVTSEGTYPYAEASIGGSSSGGDQWIDSRLRLSLYTSLEQIGVTVGSETMEAIALALPDNAVLEASCGSGNNGVTDGTAFPVDSGSALIYGILRVSRIGGYDRVSFEFRVKDTASSLFVGFYSSTDGWSGWKKVYTDGSKPTAAEISALPLTGGELSGPIKAVQFIQSEYHHPFETGQYIDMHLNGSEENYDGRISLDSAKYLLYNGNRIYHTGNKPSLSDLGIGNISQIAVGSYTGTGYATSANAPTLTFSFTPKFVLVMSMTDGDLGDYGYFIRNVGGYVQLDSFHIPSIEWGDKTLHYYTTNSYGSAFALNSSGTKYGYVAFG